MRLPCSELAENIGHGNPHVAEASPSPTLTRLDGDDPLVVHLEIVALFCGQTQYVVARFTLLEPAS